MGWQAPFVGENVGGCGWGAGIGAWAPVAGAEPPSWACWGGAWAGGCEWWGEVWRGGRGGLQCKSFDVHKGFAAPKIK